MYFDDLMEILNFLDEKYIFYFAEFILKLSNKTVFLKNITIFMGSTYSHMHAFMWRPLCENGQYVYQNPSTFEKLRSFPCWQNRTDALMVDTCIRSRVFEKCGIFASSQSHRAFKLAGTQEICRILRQSHTCAQIKKFLPDVALSSDMNN